MTLELLDSVQVPRLLLCQVSDVLLLLLLLVLVSLLQCLMVGRIEILNLFMMLGLPLSKVLLQIFDIISQALNRLQRLVVLAVVRLGLDRDLSPQFRDLHVVTTSLFLRDLQEVFVLVHIFLDVRKCSQLEVQGLDCRLHPLNLDVAIANGELQSLDLFMKCIKFSSGSF